MDREAKREGHLDSQGDFVEGGLLVPWQIVERPLVGRDYCSLVLDA